jgi:DNA-binding Lrp family transcriptional regulator
MQRVEELLTDAFTPLVTIADQLGVIPWAVLSACNRLTQRGIAEGGRGRLKGQFRRRSIA